MNSNPKSLFQIKLNNKWQKFVHSDVRQSTTKKILATIAAIFAAFVIAIIIACTVSKAWDKAGQIIGTIFSSGFQDKYLNTLFSNMAILIVGGLSFIFAYKAGLFNIGISGQMVAGATGATLICHLAGLPSGANQFVILIISMLIGALFAAIVGALKAYLKINEVVSSIMFNWIIYFMSILILGSAAIPHDSSNLNTNAPVDDLLFRMNGESLVPLLIMAGILIVIVALVLNYTVFGRKQRVTGLSNTGALAAGYNVKANMIASMAISGAIAGVLGVMIYCGFSPNMPVTAAAKAIPQDGFNGISVGLISMCSPLASVPVSLFFSMVKTSVSDLQILNIDNHISDVIFGIVVYGAAAIALFLNLKPYWLTLDIFRGKNFSKIKHERNMTNIELLSLSTDQCSILHKYYAFYQKQQRIRSTYKLPWYIRVKIWWANIRYWVVTKQSQLRVKRNKAKDIYSGKLFYKQEMVHLVVNRHEELVADLKQEKHSGWYVKVSDKVLTSPDLFKKVKDATDFAISQELMKDLQKANEEFKLHPFSDHEIRLVPLLSYLQNLRTGLTYRIEISKQNKLTYFALMQTKEQAESIGLAEIRSKKQYEFARSVYFKAYQKTYDLVKRHYDTMVKTFGRDKQLNILGVRFNPTVLETLYMNNLKKEISSIGHLINCPLSKAQLREVGALVSETTYLQSKIESSGAQAISFRKMAQPYFEKNKKLTKEAEEQYLELKAKAKKISQMVNGPLASAQLPAINELIQQADEINIAITNTKVDAADARDTGQGYIDRCKQLNDEVAEATQRRDNANKKIASIVEKARNDEQNIKQQKFEAQRIANERAERELRRLAEKRARRKAHDAKAMKGGQPWAI